MFCCAASFQAVSILNLIVNLCPSSIQEEDENKRPQLSDGVIPVLFALLKASHIVESRPLLI